MIVPRIAPIEGVSDLLDLLLNSKELHARLKTLNEMQELINERLKRYDDFESVEAMKNQADGRIAEAKAKIEEAQAFYLAKKAQAEELLERATAKSEKMEGDLRARLESLLAGEAALRKKEEELQVYAAELATRESDVAKFADTAMVRMQEAQLMQEKYVSKLDKLQSIASD